MELLKKLDVIELNEDQLSGIEGGMGCKAYSTAERTIPLSNALMSGYKRRKPEIANR